jgi:hypothetical protein
MSVNATGEQDWSEIAMGEKFAPIAHNHLQAVVEVVRWLAPPRYEAILLKTVT